MTEMDDDLRKQLEDRLNTPQSPALERVRRFLSHYVHDADLELVERIVRGVIKVNPPFVADAVQAIEELLAAPQGSGALYEVVTYDGNQMLDDETDESAAAWLKELAGHVRRWLGEHAPPRHDAGAPERMG
jgi:hypothetical protein